MPIKKGKDSNGPYYQYGNKKKYYYKPLSQRSQSIAKSKAIKQSNAIHARKHK